MLYSFEWCHELYTWSWIPICNQQDFYQMESQQWTRYDSDQEKIMQSTLLNSNNQYRRLIYVFCLVCMEMEQKNVW